MANRDADNRAFVETLQEKLGLKVDGWAGRITRDAVWAILKPTKGIVVKQEVDERSEGNIRTLHPKIQDKARELVTAFNEHLNPSGITAKIISGTRTYKEQDALYAQGRTKPGEIVTKAKAGFSNHNFGVAIDLGLFEGTKYLEKSGFYKSIAPIAKERGWEWGGDFESFPDTPHYEWPTGLTMAQKRERMLSNKDLFA